MATLKLGSTDAITESSGTITVPALGTVTSGNLSNSAIVYPAGFVVQAKLGQNVAQSSIVASTGTMVSVSIDRKLASSIFIVQANISYGLTVGNVDNSNPGFYFTHNTVLVVQNGTIFHDGFYSSDLPNIFTGNYDQRLMSNAISITDTGTVGDTEVFSVMGAVGTGETIRVNHAVVTGNAFSGGACTITVFEVKP